MRRRSRRSLTCFAKHTNDVLWRAWTYDQWPIASQKQLDDYGRPDEQQYTNYLTEFYVPAEYLAEGYVMQYVEALHMPYTELLNMRYDEFKKLTLLHKAISMRRPASWKSEQEYYMNRTRAKYGL